MDLAAEFLAAAINAFEANKRLADRAVEQVPDDKLHAALHVVAGRTREVTAAAWGLAAVSMVLLVIEHA